MAGATGLEPATSGVTGRHSNQLSYAPAGEMGLKAVLGASQGGLRIAPAFSFDTGPPAPAGPPESAGLRLIFVAPMPVFARLSTAPIQKMAVSQAKLS